MRNINSSTSLFLSGKVYRLETTDPDVARQVRKWSFIHETAWGIDGGYFRQWIVPPEKADWVAETLGLSFSKRLPTPKQKARNQKLAQMGLPFRFSGPASGIENGKSACDAANETKGIPG